MAEPAAEHDETPRQSPQIEEVEANRHPTPPPPSDDEERMAEDGIGERLPSPLSPVLSFRNVSPESGHAATPLLLNSEGT